MMLRSGPDLKYNENIKMTKNLYQTPESWTRIEEQPQTSVAGKWLALLGSILLLGLPIGILDTILSMIETFQSITLYGSGDPKVMAGGISEALISTVLGLVVALPGAVLLAISILFFKHRRPWIFRLSIAAAAFTLLLFPIGTIVAIVILVKLLKNRDSYFLGKQLVEWWCLKKSKDLEVIKSIVVVLDYKLICRVSLKALPDLHI